MLYRLEIYKYNILYIPQKNRTIKRIVYKHLYTIHKVEKSDINNKIMEVYKRLCMQTNNIIIHDIEEHKKGNPLLNGCYVYTSNGNYEKYHSNEGVE